MADDTMALTPEEIAALENGTPAPIPGGVETRSVAAIVPGDGVNVEQRIITVLAVPYEQPAPVPYAGGVWNEVFTRSAFNGLDVTKRRISATSCLKLRAPDHDGGQVVGRVINADTAHPDGLLADIKVSRTDLGDDTLELARDGNIDVSVGFAIKQRLDQTLEHRSRTRRIHRAFLDHVAFVAQPAYPGAKVLATRSADSFGQSDSSGTPMLDRFLDDPVFRWANNYFKH